MGLTSFNLVRREEEAAASAAASLSTEPEQQACSVSAPDLKKGRKKTGNLPTAEAEG
jgi:hypothetical protein